MDYKFFATLICGNLEKISAEHAIQGARAIQSRNKGELIVMFAQNAITLPNACTFVSELEGKDFNNNRTHPLMTTVNHLGSKTLPLTGRMFKTSRIRPLPP